MGGYILKRLLWAIPTLFGCLTLIFFVMRVVPGDIALTILSGSGGMNIDPVQLAALREQLGLNQPLWDQYLTWMGQVVRLDFGTSLWTGHTVWSEIGIRMPYTFMLFVLATVISMALAIPMGISAALNRDRWPDRVLSSLAIAGISVPNFWLALLVLIFIVSLFRWSAPLGYAPIWQDPGMALQQLMLPAGILAVRQVAVTARMMRSSMLEVLGEDFVRTARAKGLRENTVIYFHALKNAILPVITIFGMDMVMIIAGAIIVEQIFNIPGMGRLLLDAITHRDFPLVQGITAVVVVFVLLTNLLVDLAYSWVDPRVKLE